MTTPALAVRERPILMSAPMVRAVLDGRKCQTRRVVVPQPTDGVHPCHWVPSGWAAAAAPNEHGVVGCTCREIRCPYGAPGDRLWVRESWQAWAEFDGSAPNAIPEHARRRLNYPANGNTWDAKVRSSRFMPRWASRLTLEITAVRVQRVQEIDEVDCEAEGIYPVPLDVRNALVKSGRLADEGRIVATSRDYFRTLWDTINAARGYGWDANPWAWALTFRRVEVET